MPGTVTPSCLLYLFADQLLAKESLFDHIFLHIAVPTPGTDQEVTLGDLEVHLLAVALWSLEQAGAIGLRQVDGLPRGRFRVEPGAPPEEPWAGLEGHLLELLPPEGCSLWDLVLDRWVDPENGALPLNAVLVDAQVEAYEAGVTDEPDTPDLTPGFFGHHTFPRVAVHEARLAELRPAFDALAERWAAVAEDTDGPAHALLRECNQVLVDARPTGAVGSAEPRL